MERKAEMKMGDNGRRGRTKSSSDSYTLRELATHWGLSYQKTVQRLCDESTRLPVFVLGTNLDARDKAARVHSFADGKLVCATKAMPSGELHDLDRVREILTVQCPEHTKSHSDCILRKPQFLFLGSQRDPYLGFAEVSEWRKRFRVRRDDVEAYDNRPKIELKLRMARRRGGTAPKRLPGVWRGVLDLVRGNPRITAKQAWQSFPEAEPGQDEDLIYRDGNSLVEVCDATGKPRAITYDTFRGYLKAARKEANPEQ